MRRLSLFTVTGLVAAGLTLSACGSNSLSTSPGAGSAPAGSTSAAGGGVDQALAAKVPAKIKSAGKIVVGTDADLRAQRVSRRPTARPSRAWTSTSSTPSRPSSASRPSDVPAGFDTIILGVTERQVRHRRLELHHQPRPQEAGQHGQLLQGRHAVGRRQGQPREGQHRRRLRQERRRAEGHRAGRRPRRAQQEVHRRRQARRSRRSSRPARTRSPPTSPAGKTDAMLADSPVGLYAVEADRGTLELLGEHLRLGSLRLRAAQGPDRLRPTSSSTPSRPLKADGSYDAALKK